MIRPAQPEDVEAIHAMVRELAEYEKSLSEAKATPEQLHAALFGERPAAFAHVAQDESGAVVGFALWFLNFSTWTGVPGSTWRTSTSARPRAAAATERRCSPSSPGSASSGGTGGSSGRCSTG